MKNSTESQISVPAGSQDYFGHNLIFIISQPRAGSTLLQRMLAGHQDIQTSAETWLMLHPVYGMRRHGIKTDFRAQWAATGVKEFLENYAEGEETYRDGIRKFAEAIYGRILTIHDKRLFLDKTPRYTMIVPDLKKLFPLARFILLIRNPLAVLSSELHTYIANDWWKISNFNPDLLDAPQRLVDARATLGEQAIEVKYEALVTEPEIQLQRICEHLNIEYRPAMLDYSDTPEPVGRMNDPVGIHKHTGPSDDSLQKWRSLGSNAQHRHFALGYLDELGDQVLNDLGYDPTELRSAVESATIDQQSNVIYPWRLAIVPRQRWSLFQKTAATYYLEAQRKGKIAAGFAALGVLLGRAGSISGRLGGQRNKRSEQLDTPDAGDLES